MPKWPARLVFVCRHTGVIRTPLSGQGEKVIQRGGRRGGNKQEDFFEETLVRISLICTSQTEPYFYADGEKSPRRRLYIALSVLLKEPSTTHLSCSAGMLRTLQTVSLKEGTCF